MLNPISRTNLEAVQSENSNLLEPIISSDLIFQGKIFSVKKHLVSLSDGSESFRECVYHNGGAAVLAVDESEEEPMVYLVRQYRIATDEILFEIPAGKIEYSESVSYCAQRELQEEIGFEADRFEFLLDFYPTPGYCSESIHLFLARDLRFVGANLDEGEFLSVYKISLREALEGIALGKIKDGKTIIALLYYSQNYKNN